MFKVQKGISLRFQRTLQVLAKDFPMTSRKLSGLILIPELKATDAFRARFLTEERFESVSQNWPSVLISLLNVDSYSFCSRLVLIALNHDNLASSSVFLYGNLKQQFLRYSVDIKIEVH